MTVRGMCIEIQAEIGRAAYLLGSPCPTPACDLQGWLPERPAAHINRSHCALWVSPAERYAGDVRACVHERMMLQTSARRSRPMCRRRSACSGCGTLAHDGAHMATSGPSCLKAVSSTGDGSLLGANNPLFGPIQKPPLPHGKPNPHIMR